jgi:hypothetical protein
MRYLQDETGMNEIPRFKRIGAYNQLVSMQDGDLCRWSDVEALIKERDDLRAKALAAVWLLPEDTNMAGLVQLYSEARSVFMGKYKQTIANLQDELANAREEYRLRTYPTAPGVNAVYGIKGGDKAELRYVLMITSVQHAPNGGLEIEVQLP